MVKRADRFRLMGLGRNLSKFALLLGFFALGCGSRHNQEPKEDWQPLLKRDMDVRVFATGKVMPWLSVDIKCKASGQILELPYAESARVKKGDLLLSLDPVDENRRLQSSELNFEVASVRARQSSLYARIAAEELNLKKREAQTQLEFAQSRHEDAVRHESRIKELQKNNLATSADFENAITQTLQTQSDLQKAISRVEDLKTDELRLEAKELEVHISQNDVRLKEVAVELSRQALADTRIYSPMSGVVTGLKVQIGQIISSGISNVGGGTTILTLADDERLLVRALVDESDIGRVRLGQVASFSVDSYIFERFTGKVVRIASSGETVQNVVLFEVDIEVTDARKDMLKPGMSANVEVEVLRVKDQLAVPFHAIQEDKGQPWVLARLGDSAPQRRNVKLGLDDGEYYLIEAGLESVDRVRVATMGVDDSWDKRGRAGIRF